MYTYVCTYTLCNNYVLFEPHCDENLRNYGPVEQKKKEKKILQDPYLHPKLSPGLCTYYNLRNMCVYQYNCVTVKVVQEYTLFP